MPNIIETLFILVYFCRFFVASLYIFIQSSRLDTCLDDWLITLKMVVVLFVSWIPGQLSTVQEHLDILSLSIFGLMLKTWNYTTRFSFVGLIAFDMSREWPRRLSVITLSLFEKLIREQNTIRDSPFFASLANYARCKINLENFYGPLCFDSCKRTVKIKKLIKKPLTFLSLEFLIKLYPKNEDNSAYFSVNQLIDSFDEKFSRTD